MEIGFIKEKIYIVVISLCNTKEILLKCGCLVMFSFNQTSKNSFRLVNIHQELQIVDDWWIAFETM